MQELYRLMSLVQFVDCRFQKHGKRRNWLWFACLGGSGQETKAKQTNKWRDSIAGRRGRLSLPLAPVQ